MIIKGEKLRGKMFLSLKSRRMTLNASYIGCKNGVSMSDGGRYMDSWWYGWNTVRRFIEKISWGNAYRVHPVGLNISDIYEPDDDYMLKW